MLPEDAIETSRFRDDRPAISPSGKRYVIRLIRGDNSRNGYWMDVYSGELASIESAAAKRTASLFSTGLGTRSFPLLGPDADAYNQNPIRWLGEHRIAFCWSDNNAVRQIVAVDLISGKVEQLTHAERPLSLFDVAPDGSVVYNEMVGRTTDRSAQLLEHGLAIGNDTLGFDIVEGRFDSSVGYYDSTINSRWFVQSPSKEALPIRFGISPIDITLPQYRTLSVSPNGKLAIVSGAPRDIPAEWDRYTDPWHSELIRKMRIDARGPFARRAIQLFVVSAADGSTRPLWSAPAPLGVPAIWSHDSKWVLLAPTFLPASKADSAGLAGIAAAVVNVRSGDYMQLPITIPDYQAGASGTELEAQWEGDSVIRLKVSERSHPAAVTHLFKLSNGGWSESPLSPQGGGASHVHLEIRANLETPPRLIAVDAHSGREAVALDPNSELTRTFALGKAEVLHGKEEDGTRWEALLFHPVPGEGKRPFPLVIQVGRRDFSSTEFSLYDGGASNGLGPPIVPVAAGRLLASRGIAVATVTVHPPDEKGTSEGPARVRAFEAVVRRLSDLGFVDPTKVGLVGFSRGGYWVQYVITHSRFAYAAAVAGDNFDPSYFQTALANWRVESTEVIGAEPFGDGLSKWLAEAPGFNAQSVSAPLLMIGQSIGARGAAIGAWELFSRLRHLHKPVELYLMPDIDRHPSHGTQNPLQVLAVLNRTIDWFDFWLCGEERESGSALEQYEGWRKLRQLRDGCASSSGGTCSAGVH